MTSNAPLSTEEVQALQTELTQARSRIVKLEEQKQTYENHLDDLIKTVAQRSQHIRDIERDLKKIQTIQALSTDYASSIDPEDIHPASPDRYVYCADPHGIINHKRAFSVRSELNATQPVTSFLGRNLLLDTEEIANPTYSEVGGPVSYGSEYYYKRSSQPQTPNAEMPTARFNPSFSQTNVLRKSQDSGERSTDKLPQRTSPTLRELESLESKLKRKSEKVKNLKKMVEIKAQRLQVMELESSQNKLTLKLLLKNYFPRIKSQLDTLRRQIISETKMAERELGIQLNGLKLGTSPQKAIQKKLQEAERDNERAIAALKQGYEELLAKRDREHSKEIEAVVKAIKAQMEIQNREAIKEAGCQDKVELKMRVTQLQREKEDLETHIGMMLRAEGEQRQEALVSAETLRRKQLEKSYQELVRLREQRTAQFQKDIKEIQAREQKMRKSVQNLIAQLECKENVENVEKRVIHHNKAVLQAILEGRSFMNESLMISSREEKRKQEEKKPPAREDELVYMGEKKSSQSCLPSEPMLVVTETESFEYVAPVFTENYSLNVVKKKLVEDKAGRKEDEKQKKSGGLFSFFSGGEKKPKAHKIHVRPYYRQRGEKNTSYYDKDKGKWVFPGQPEEQTKALKPPPRAPRDTRAAPRSKINKRGFYAPSFDDSQLHQSSTDIVTEFKPLEVARPKSFIKPPTEDDEPEEFAGIRGPSASEHQEITPKPEEKEEIKGEEESEESVAEQLESEEVERRVQDEQIDEEEQVQKIEERAKAVSIHQIQDISPVGQSEGEQSPPQRRSHFTLQRGPNLRSQDLSDSGVNSEEEEERQEDLGRYRESAASGSPEMNMMANINFATTMNSSFYDQENPSLAHILEQRFQAEKQDIIEQFMKEREQLEFEKDDKIDDLEGEIETLREELEIHIKTNAENQLKIKKLEGDVTRNGEEANKFKIKTYQLEGRIQELEEADAIRGARGLADEENEISESIKTEYISENQESQKQILSLVEERNELLEEVAGLKEEIKAITESNAEEIESLKNIQSLRISELETEAGDGAKEVETRLLRALDQEKKKHSKKVKEMNGKIQELKKALNEHQQHDKQYLTRIHQQNDSIAKLEGEIHDQSERFQEERESFVLQVEGLKEEKEELSRRQERETQNSEEKTNKLEKQIEQKEERVKEVRKELAKMEESMHSAQSESKQLKRRVVEVEKKASEEVVIVREDNTPLKQLYVETEAQFRTELKQRQKLESKNGMLGQKVKQQEQCESRVKDTLNEVLGIEVGDLDDMLLRMISVVERLKDKGEGSRRHETKMLEIQLIQSKKRLEFQNTKYELLKTGFYKLKQTYLIQEDKFKEKERLLQEIKDSRLRKDDDAQKWRLEAQKLQRRVTETEEAYLDQKDKIERLEFEYLSLQRELESTKRISNAHRDEALSQEMNRNSLESEKTELKEKIQKLEHQKRDMAQELEERKGIKESGMEEAVRIKEEALIEKYEKEQKEAEQIWKQEAAKAIDKLKLKIKEQKEKIKQLSSGEIKELEAALSQKNKQLAQIQRDKSAEVNLLNSRINALKAEKEAKDLPAQLELKSKELETALSSLQTSQLNLEKLEREKKKISERLEEVEDGNTTVQAKLKQKEMEIDSLNEALKQAQNKHHSLSQDYLTLLESSKKEEEGDLKQQVEQKEQEIAILQDELGRVQTEVKKYKVLSDKSETAKRIHELEDLVHSLKEENQIIKEQYRESIQDPKEYALLEEPPQESSGLISTFASFFLTKSDLKK